MRGSVSSAVHLTFPDVGGDSPGASRPRRACAGLPGAAGARAI